MPDKHDLESPDGDIRLEAIQRLGHARNWWAHKQLTAIALNQNEPELARIYALQALSYPYSRGKIARALRGIIFDETENLNIRVEVIEWCSGVLRTDKQLSLFQKLFEHPAADIRFWTVFALTNMGHTWHNIAPVLDKLDRIAAFDDHIPEFFGWHVHREALAALEHLYFRRYCGRRERRRDYPSMRLISPAPEYVRYDRLYRSYDTDFRKLDPAVMPKPTLVIEKAWLKAQLQMAWPEIIFQVRPNSQAYQLSWIVKIEGQRLLGGLHRDGYAVVVTGADTARNRFICWYRDIIAEHDLFAYEWASVGIPLQTGITPEQIVIADEQQYSNLP